tara:strand:- start:12601 stop:14229 length:1629 start_codon:yes stop_codon:yes gene_type:complete
MISLIKKSIRAKLSISMGIVSLCLVVMFLIYGNLTNKLNTGVSNLGTKFMPSQSAILNADRDLYQAYVAQLIYIETAAPEQKNDYEENAQQALDRMKIYLSTLSDYPDITNKLNQFDAQFQAWKNVADQVFTLVDSGQKDEAYQLLHAKSDGEFSKLRDLYDIAGEAVNLRASTDVESLYLETEQTDNTLIIFLCLVVILIIALTYMVPKMQVDGIRELVVRIKEISQGDGDLTQRISSTRTDELGQLANTFDDFIAQLQALIKELSESSQELNHNAIDLDSTYQSSQELNKSQTDNIEMIATAVNEFSASIREVASNVQNATDATGETDLLTEQGMQAIEHSEHQVKDLAASIENAKTVIENLTEDSDNIATVLDVIRSIAEQTNLLALNAAIEAARAGEQGRGFAVVADEVRSLASKTQHSTEEIQQMINKLQIGVKNAVSSILEGSEKVQQNVESVGKTKEMFASIQISSRQVNDLTSQIAVATEQQSNVSEEINSNIVNLNDKNVQSQALAHKVQEISGLVGSCSKKLAKDINRFTVK